MTFQSATFTAKSIDLKELNEDIDAISNLTSSQKLALVEFLSEGSNLARKEEVLGERLESFLRAQGIPGDGFQRARRLLHFVADRRTVGDSPEAILQDLSEAVELGSQGETGTFSAYDFLDRMVPALHQMGDLYHRQAAIRRGMPSLIGVNYSCDVRMVAKRHFRPLEEDSNTYDPIPECWVPIAILNLTTDEDTEFYCQLDLKQLNKLIDSLRAVRKDLVLAKQQLGDAGLPARHVDESDNEVTKE